MNLREKVTEALKDSIAPELLDDTVDCVMQILEEECQSSFDDGYEVGIESTK